MQSIFSLIDFTIILRRQMYQSTVESKRAVQCQSNWGGCEKAVDATITSHKELFNLGHLPVREIVPNKDNVAKLEPIFKRSFDLSMNFDWNSQIGNLESDG